MNTPHAPIVTSVINPSLPASTRRRVLRMSKIGAPVAGPAPMRQVRHRDEIVGPLALDLPSRKVLLRAQQAITRILNSEVYAEDFRATVQESALRRHEWEIAVALRDITELRIEHASSTSAESPGPLTAAVLASHQRAIGLAEEATALRVSALERYASQLQGADAARQDWRDSVRLAGLNDKYLDLVARTAADEQALAELSGLAEQAALAAHAFHESVQQASLAGEALVLPAPKR
jgi:hypothetical protein